MYTRNTDSLDDGMSGLFLRHTILKYLVDTLFPRAHQSKESYIFNLNSFTYLYTVGRLNPQTLANSLTFIVPATNAR